MSSSPMRWKRLLLQRLLSLRRLSLFFIVKRCVSLGLSLFLGIRSLFFSFAAVNAHRVAHMGNNTKCHDVDGTFPLQLLLETYTISRHLTVVESNLPTPTDDFTGDWSVDTSRLYQKLPICIYVLVWLEFSFMKISDKVTTVSPISNNSCATVKRYQRAVDALSCCFRRTPESE